ncbi:MAG: hypothetical protein U9Q37_08375 [Euryarchaeota archaeon]|nr:hypothetical protein [Euryarchaeota archaeon]
MRRRPHLSHQPTIHPSVRIVDRVAGVHLPEPPARSPPTAARASFPPQSQPGSNHDRTRNRACRLPVGIYSGRRLREGGGRVVLTTGVPINVPGTTNLIRVRVVE